VRYIGFAYFMHDLKMLDSKTLGATTTTTFSRDPISMGLGRSRYRQYLSLQTFLQVELSIRSHLLNFRELYKI